MQNIKKCRFFLTFPIETEQKDVDIFSRVGALIPLNLPHEQMDCDFMGDTVILLWE